MCFKVDLKYKIDYFVDLYKTNETLGIFIFPLDIG